VAVPIAAGQLGRAGQVPRIAQYNLVCSGALTTSTTFADVTGLSQSFTTVYDDAVALVVASFDLNVTGAIGAGGLAAGQIVVDGVAQTGQADLHANIVNRGTPASVWSGLLATAGSHTIKAQGRKTIAAGTVEVQTQSKMVIVVFDVDTS
jgi:hypothetical protein